MRTETYLLWDGTEAQMKWIYDPIFKKTVPSVKRLIDLPQHEQLHDAIFDSKTGRFRTETAMHMTPADRSSWLHLWDGVCCKSISPLEAYDAISLGYIPENLKVRASNYMHLI